MNKVPEIVKIKEIIDETPTVKTFIFDWDMDKFGIPQPGEFLMVWNFNDEKPMSISFINEDKQELGISVKNIGIFTNDLHNLNAGDEIGIRGSYGNGFKTDLKDKTILAIGGGVGMAPINSLSSNLLRNNNVDVISAATTKDELLFIDYLESKGANLFPCTDDGSFGFEGFATDQAINLLKDTSYDMAFVCGPEIMMKLLFDILEDSNIPAQYSMERYMKCALGLCGQCCVDDTGWRVCVEGPVFDENQLKQITEFGKYNKDASGLKHYY